MLGGKCKFQLLGWTTKTRQWVRTDTNDSFRAKCAISRKSIVVATMGESALKTRLQRAKHQSGGESAASSLSITSYLPASDLVPDTPRHKHADANTLRAATLDADCRKHEMAVEAEILWTMKAVSSHYSYNSCRDVASVFQRMFPDSEIARSSSCNEKRVVT
ncbi:hypothetical protein HPB47_014592 [Ixodes persulcatus]|uniref:Uncharacterized protein n=1 Tax=Ixodes persulcatus TaxID=34615 RepID=A0AC60QWS9_IXOPE|nr:hypothetical protein HPB47_014592 [Ixodes persulcatus]